MELLKARNEIARLKEQLEIKDALINASFEAVGIFDEKLNCLATNAEAEKVFGYSAAEIVGRSVFDIFVKESRCTVRENIIKGTSEPYFVICKCKNGSTFPAEVKGRNVIINGRKYRASAVRDLTYTYATEVDLVNALHEIELMFNNCDVGLVLLKDGRHLSRANQALVSLLGYNSFEEIKGSCTRQFHLSRKHYSEFGANSLPELINGKSFKCEWQVRRKDGQVVWCSFSGQALDMNVPADLNKGVLWVVEDITKRKKKDERMKRRATKDDLTGALRRQEFFLSIRCLMEDIAQDGLQCSILMLDLDKFKNINDKYGHWAGDIVLRDFAELCKEQLRHNDIFARIGGEEFAVFLPQTTLSEAVLVAERLRERFAETDSICGGNLIPCTVSVGVASGFLQYRNIEESFRRADKRLYKAKEMGRNMVVSFD